jgi:transposase
MMPGAVVSQIARRWQICPQQEFAWRRAALRGTPTDLVTIGPAFVPIVEGPSVAEQAPAKTVARTPEIEIEAGGTKIRLAGGVDTKALTAVLRAVRAAAS